MKFFTLFLPGLIVLVCAITNIPSLILANPNATNQAETLEIKSAVKQAYKMKVLIGTIGISDRIAAIAKVIEADLRLPREKQTGFEIIIEQFASEPNGKSEIKKLLDRGFSLVVFLSATGIDDISYRIYDATDATMVKGKKLVLTHYSIANTGHYLAGILTQEFLGRPIQFGAQLAFCKQDSKKGGKQLFATDPHAEHAYQTLVSSQTPKFGLRWFMHDDHKFLYYSEQSPVNVRLMQYDMEQKRSKLVMNFDGLNMQPSFNKDGSKVVVCCSQAGSSQLYRGTLDPLRKQWIFKRLTHNNGNNISPYLCKNGDVFFCSDYQTRSPQLYCYRDKDGSIDRLTDGGYCASPAVCEEQGKIAYIKLINNVAQICMYDIATKNHTQVTFDATQKDEPSWSPCGTYLAYSVEQGTYSRIAVRNMISQEAYFVTAAHEQCTSPAWGPGVMC
ncbi:MAG: TolB family protein [Candidatus Babeliales bacterium]